MLNLLTIVTSITKNNVNINLDICTMDNYSKNFFDRKQQKQI